MCLHAPTIGTIVSYFGEIVNLQLALRPPPPPIVFSLSINSVFVLFPQLCLIPPASEDEDQMRHTTEISNKQTKKQRGLNRESVTSPK